VVPSGSPFVRDNDAPSIIPDAGEVTAVQAHIDSVRPLGAEVFVFAPTPVAQDFEIQPSPATQAVRDAIVAELKDLWRRKAEPGGTIRLSWVREAVSVAAGEDYSVVITPNADIVRAPGEISTIGNFTWT
jgi:uncharacterized phage protein gp47/JayE